MSQQTTSCPSDQISIHSSDSSFPGEKLSGKTVDTQLHTGVGGVRVCMSQWERRPLSEKALVLICSTLDSMLPGTQIRETLLYCLLCVRLWQEHMYHLLTWTYSSLQPHILLFNNLQSACWVLATVSTQSELADTSWSLQCLFTPNHDKRCAVTELPPVPVVSGAGTTIASQALVLLLLYPLHFHKTQIPKLSSIHLRQ